MPKFTSHSPQAAPSLKIMGEGYNVPGSIPDHMLTITPDLVGYQSLWAFTGYGSDVDSDLDRGAPKPVAAAFAGSYGALARAGKGR